MYSENTPNKSIPGRNSKGGTRIGTSLLGILTLCISCNILAEGKPDPNNDLLLALALLPRDSGYAWNLPPGFPIPKVPRENPMTEEKVELGRHLFYDTRLSADQTMSCSSCHRQSLAFTDGRALPRGIATDMHPLGEEHPRNSQNLANVAYASRLTWNNPLMKTLEQQARTPLFGDRPVELGLQDLSFLNRLRRDPLYQDLFSRAFPGRDPFSERNVRFALASFQRSLISGNSRFDQAVNGKRNVLSPAAARGASFFNSEIAECFHCHGGFNFTDTNLHGSQSAEEFAYHNNGTHTEEHYNGLPIEKQGLIEITKLPRDQGKFKAPSLRNVALTYPYMHDGSITCDDEYNPDLPEGMANNSTRLDCARNALGKVVDQYARGGNAPVHPNVDGTLIREFPMSSSEREELIEFLISLTDEEFIRNRKFSNPFRR